jgi:hypothetical protein
MLLARFPQATWPEQLGLIGGLFGATVIGHWWLGLVVWVLARFAWLIRVAVRVSGGLVNKSTA